MELNKKLKDEIWDYCRMNDITDVDGFIEKMTQQGYSIEKYGTSPIDFTPETIEVEKIVEVEVIKEVEKVVEIEVEKIVEVIKEIPVEVIKEVEVLKEVYKTDDEVVNKLQLELGETKETLRYSIQEFDEDRKAHSKIVSEKDVEIDTLNRKIPDLTNNISQLETELETEKLKPKRVKQEIKAPESTDRKSSISWVSKNERNSDNLYDE